MFNENIGMVYCDYELIDLEGEFTKELKWNISEKIEKINIFSGAPRVLKGINIS